jgi:outer membrane protein insertion porin family
LKNESSKVVPSPYGSGSWEKTAAFVFACGLAFALTLSAYGQEKKLVRKIDVEGLRRVPETEVRAQIKTTLNQPYDSEQVTSDIRRIYALGYFSDVAAVAEDYEDGLRIIFRVVEKPLLLSISIKGNRKIKDAELLDVIPLKGGTSFAYSDIEEAVQQIAEVYKEKGFLFVQVQEEVKETPEGTEVILKITEGPRPRIARIRFSGNAAFSSRELMALLVTRPWRLIISPGTYDEETLASDLLRVRNYYRDRGWLDAEVSRELEFSRNKKRIYLTIIIEEGTRYTIAEINLMGNQAIPGSEIRGEIGLSPGEPFSAIRLRSDLEAVRGLYGRRGYMLAAVNIETSYAPDYQVIITYNIVENEPIYVERIEIRGNQRTRQDVIRRELTFYPGELFNIEQLRNSRQRLINTFLFSEVDFSYEPGSLPSTRNVIVEVEETETGFFMIGGGVSSDLGVSGHLTYVQRNFDIRDYPESLREFLPGRSFVGGGQTFRIEVAPGTEYSSYSVYYRQPWLFDRPVGLSTNLYYYQHALESYDEERLGAVIALDRRTREDLTLAVAVRVEEVDITNLASNAPADVVKVRGTNSIVSVTFSADYDKRDNPWLPSKGYRLRGSVEVAGGDHTFGNLTVDARSYKTLKEDDEGRKKHIVAVGGRVGVGAGDVPVFERFFAGGARSIRGFEYRGVGPRMSGYPTGGELLFLANAEYGFPLHREAIRGHFFVDAGGVWSDIGDFEPGEIRAAAGFGLRLYISQMSPIPIALDFAVPITSEPGDDEQIFSFSIGAFF